MPGAQLHLEHGRRDEAVADLERIERFAADLPHEARVSLLRARLALDDDNLHEAESQLDHAVDIAPNFADPFYVRAQLRPERQDWPGALQDLDRVIALIGATPELVAMRAEILTALRDKVGALRELDELIEKNPTPEARGLRGQILV